MKRSAVYLLLLMLAACTRPPQPVWTELPTSAQLLERLQTGKERFYSLDAEVSASLTMRGKALSSRQFLLLERPDRLRADVLTGFGQVALQLASDGQQLAVFVNTESPPHFYRGPSTDANVARFTRVPLATSSLIRLLLYDPPLFDNQEGKVEQHEGNLQLTLETADRRQELTFDRQLQLVGCRYLQGTKLLLAVRYRQIADDGFPHKVEIDLPLEQTSLALTFADLQTNISISPEKFVLHKPDNLDVEPIP